MVCKSCNGVGYHVIPDEHDDPIQTPCLECASETWRIFHGAAYEKVSDLTANLAAAESRIAELEELLRLAQNDTDRATDDAGRWQAEALAWRHLDAAQGGPPGTLYAARVDVHITRAANEKEGT